MTVCMYLVYEGCGSGHFTVDGADDDLKTRDKCDGTGPGVQESDREGEVVS